MLNWKWLLPLLLIAGGLAVGHAMKRKTETADMEAYRSDACTMLCYQCLASRTLDPTPAPAPEPAPSPGGKKTELRAQDIDGLVQLTAFATKRTEPQSEPREPVVPDIPTGIRQARREPEKTVAPPPAAPPPKPPATPPKAPAATVRSCGPRGCQIQPSQPVRYWFRR